MKLIKNINIMCQSSAVPSNCIVSNPECAAASIAETTKERITLDQQKQVTQASPTITNDINSLPETQDRSNIASFDDHTKSRCSSSSSSDKEISSSEDKQQNLGSESRFIIAMTDDTFLQLLVIGF